MFVALAAAGCTGSGGPTDPASARTAETLTWQDGSDATGTVVDLATAREARPGEDYVEQLTTAATPPTSDYLLTLALADDGTIIASQIPPQTARQREGIVGARQLVGYDVAGQQWTASSPNVGDDSPRQIYAASTDGDVTAWAETASIRLDASNWRIFSRDGDGQASLVARSEDVFDKLLPLLNGDTRPVVRDGRVYWATAAPTNSAGTAFWMVVQSRDAHGTGPIRTEIGGASSPAVTPDGLFVIRSARDDAQVEDGEATIEEVTEPGTSQVVARYAGSAGATLHELVGAGGRVAVVQSTQDGGAGAIHVLEPRTRTALVVPLPSSARSTSLAMCGGTLVWSSADGSGSKPFEPLYVLDLDTLDLARVEVEYDYSGAYCAGDLVGWRALSADPKALATTTLVRWSPDPR